MDNCLQPVLTAAWQKRIDVLFWSNKKKLSLNFDIYQLTKRAGAVEILLAFSSFFCLPRALTRQATAAYPHQNGT
ncbi:hypothetical protein HV183_07495 [Citrobacter freundii]|uniref:Uncharacterized protein n=1 Tax=Citrobacter freundii TaxID=546 RepID=A0AAE7GS19_CITFR|nr:hypothetical protein [Citrobacter freundii]QLO13293.1 hypothetical protein HV183_07495 [Citrobacter freundii]QMJ02868.1 hypothetical protein HVY06_07000 [Citrobacter freundii]QMJ11938.1 hypothetical protein HVY04_07000 [Citrobacter freundii]